ncbi:MAG: hypothetical protein JO276_17955 [Sphingomonadaceae bacterium]|nr:hypothetical protein [Sphingomonadaceae bacterium]
MLFLLLVPAAAPAGIRATYAGGEQPAMTIEIADNGDVRADVAEGWQLIVLGGRAYLVQDRLTGPLVMRVEDLAALLPASRASAAAASGGSATIAERGSAVVNGRIGRAFFFPHATGLDAGTPAAVISSDPALAPLGAAMHRAFAAEALIGALDWGWPADNSQDALLALFEQGAPLKYYDIELSSLERVPIDGSRFALPAEPETAEAVRARRAAEAREEARPHPDNMISRAVFADGRLWLLTDHGRLSSLVQGERTRRQHELDEDVLDICVHGSAPVILTGDRWDGEGWTLRRWQGGAWRAVRMIARSFDYLVALSCGDDWEVALTSNRLIDLTGRIRAATLSQPLYPPRVRTVVHVTQDAVWVGLNEGEWGGGLRRIDRRSGAVATIERNPTGSLCDGPLNSACDPVNGLATIPWQPRCIAAAIGLMHMATHGRIVAACPQGVTQLFAADAAHPLEGAAAPEAASDGYGTVAFFGLTATGNALIAVGHDGLYRIEADGTGARRPWPRFVEVDGILVSFALPDVVLVMSNLNRRASLSSLTALMAVR